MTNHVAGSAREPMENSMCTIYSEMVTGFDSGPLKHISNTVIASMFPLVAFGVARSKPWCLY